MGSSSIWATATATPPVRGTSASTVTATASVTTTQAFETPVGTDGASLIGVKAPDNGGLSGGAIAGIVIGTIAGVFLILRRRKETTYVEDRYSHHSHARPEGRTWFGARPSAPADGGKKSRWGNWASIGIILGALALCLGLKRRRNHDEKSDYTYPSSYYTYSDYTSATKVRADEQDAPEDHTDLIHVHDGHEF
ncbi:hypothetical protein EYZ11_010918 [Aspergillus tanneri]|uniref:Uncharacterized protein n=1 Tax=Aspergillus tanneri TaxID=1220188 RepID=A0A4S3J429_9EURO|nr:hypothetical protein EYZ11_010918 [Aspergillus tanneri]